MEQQKVTVTIVNTNYTLVTDELTSYVEGLGATVDRQIRDIMISNKRMSLMAATVLAALNLADETEKAKKEADNLRQQMKSYLDENAKIRMEADKLRRELQERKTK